MRQSRASFLRTRLLLDTSEESEQTNTRDLDDLETDTGDITLGLTPGQVRRQRKMAISTRTFKTR